MEIKEFEILDNLGEKLTLIFSTPEMEDLEQADIVHAAKIASLIRLPKDERPLLRSELDDFLRQNGMWSERDQSELNSINEDISSLLAKLKTGGIKLSEGREIAINITDKRQSLVQLMQKRQSFDDSTIESMADNEKTDYFIYACTRDSVTGNRYWESFADMKADKDSEAYKNAISISMSVLYGIDSNFEKNLPENKWLKKYNYIDDNLSFIDRTTGKYVDRDGTPIEQVQDELLDKLQSIIGEIEEETPFIDDETGMPVGEKKKKKPTTRKKRTTKKKSTTKTKVES